MPAPYLSSRITENVFVLWVRNDVFHIYVRVIQNYILWNQAAFLHHLCLHSNNTPRMSTSFVSHLTAHQSFTVLHLFHTRSSHDTVRCLDAKGRVPSTFSLYVRTVSLYCSAIPQSTFVPYGVSHNYSYIGCISAVALRTPGSVDLLVTYGKLYLSTIF